MNVDILMPLVTLSGVAVAAGYMLHAIGGSNHDKFDERQLIERGRGANLAMTVALCYLLGVYAGLSFELVDGEYAELFAVYGLVLVVMVSDCWCIFHDAYLEREQDVWSLALQNGLLGGGWLAIMLSRRDGDLYAWINGAFAFTYLCRSGMLVLRELTLRIRRRFREEDDG